MGQQPPLDLVDAVEQALRASECAGLFGDTWDQLNQTGIRKFFADYADSADFPYLVIGEVGESYEYMTHGPGNNRPYLAHGTLAVNVMATGRRDARELGYAVGRALNDAHLHYIDQRHMSLRLASAQFIPSPLSGPGTPTVFVRMLTFSYDNQGAL